MVEKTLYCKKAGSKVPCVVLLHAFPLSHRMWEPQLEALSKKARVLAPDLPGFGRSARQTPSLPAAARSVARLLDRLDIREPVIVAGLSMGGYVAFEFYRQFPERVAGLGLFSTRAGADSPEQKKARLKLARRIGRDGLKGFAESFIPKLLGKTTLEKKPAVKRFVKRIISSSRAGGVSDALRAMAQRRDNGFLLSKIKKPALIIAGKEDAVIPEKETLKMKRALRSAHLRILPHAGHLVNLESPDAFLKEFLRFIRTFEEKN